MEFPNFDREWASVGNLDKAAIASGGYLLFFAIFSVVVTVFGKSAYVSYGKSESDYEKDFLVKAFTIRKSKNF